MLQWLFAKRKQTISKRTDSRRDYRLALSLVEMWLVPACNIDAKNIFKWGRERERVWQRQAFAHSLVFSIRKASRLEILRVALSTKHVDSPGRFSPSVKILNVFPLIYVNDLILERACYLRRKYVQANRRERFYEIT